MPPRARSAFVCQQCAFQSPKWIGRCPSCDGWNTFVEERVVALPKGRGGPARMPRAPIALGDVPADAEQRLATGIGEFDRVLGGGIVRGSCVLLGGDPGIGKSSLLMQASAALARGGTVLYVSGEESAAQVKLRARRFGIAGDGILLLAETDLAAVLEAIQRTRPTFVVVDSIQTMSSDAVGSAAGGVSQLRECTARLLELAKGDDIPIFLVGHVTKEGAVAGPRVLEHIVDAVLYLEGERFHAFRILRATKNRFGSTDEVGVFEMGEAGLRIREPAADLGLAVAVASALRDRAADPRTVFIGELGLGGELRRVQRVVARLREAERLGFARAVIPAASLGDLDGTALEVVGASSLREALERSGVIER